MTTSGMDVFRRAAIAGIATLLFAGPALAEQASPPSPSHPTFFDRWVARRLSIGADFTYFWLEDTRRASDGGFDNENPGNFLGSLWGLDAEQHAFPSPFLEYRVVSVVGVGVAYDEARARTLDWADENQTVTAGDGDLEIRGLLYYVFARFPGRTRLAPYAELGLAHYWSRFDASPGWLAPGRRFEVDDTGGWFLAAGVRVTLWRKLRLDVLYRHSETEDVAARAYLRHNRYLAGAFPMRSDLLGAGLVYAF